MGRPSNKQIRGRKNQAKAKDANRCDVQRCVVQHCCGVTEKGLCRKRQRYELCHWHGKSLLKVRVGKSTVVDGHGLFTTATFKAGDFVGLYSGEVLTGKEFSERYNNKNKKVPQYVYEMNSNCYIDAANNRCLMAMINSSRRSHFSPNCELMYDRRNKIVKVLVKKEIKEILPNTELLIAYAIPISIIK